MFRFVTVCLAFLLLTASPSAEKRKSTFLTETWKSVVKYVFTYTNPEGQVAKGHCTAFAVRFDPPVYITAAHCPPEGTIDELATTAIYKTNQILAVQGGKPRPILILGNRPNYYEDSIYQFGYGGPAQIPFLFEARVVADNASLYPNQNDPVMIFSNGSVKGMSGGPIVNSEGRLVSVVECGGAYDMNDAVFGCGVSFEELNDVVRKVTAR